MNNQICMVVMIFFSLTTTNAFAQCPVVEKKDMYSEQKIGEKSKLASHLSQSELQKVNELINQYQCSATDISILKHPSRPQRLISIDCAPPSKKIYGSKDPDLWESLFVYPFIATLNDGLVERVDFSGWAFMYQSGSIKTISDVDQNGLPEFCLSGPACECGEDEKACNCESEIFAEAQHGKLVKLNSRKRK